MFYVFNFNLGNSDFSYTKSKVDPPVALELSLSFLSFSFSCREKKDSEVHHLEENKNQEHDLLQPLEDENAQLRREIDSMKEKYKRMRDFARKNNLQIKERKEVPLTMHGQSL